MHKINVLITLSVIAVLLSSCGLARNVSKEQGGIVIADKGQAKAVIVVAGNANKNALDAAQALQKIVQQMTEAELAIKKESEFTNQAMPIYVGMSKLVGKAGVVIEQGKDVDDHYIISVNDKRIILAGNDGGRRRGSAYAVYDLLGRLGCGWYRTDPLWHVIPKKATLEIPRMYVDERPAFEFRDIWFVNNEQLLIDAWRMGGRRISMNHDLDRLVPEKVYGKEHPEYFGKYQPCLTHPDVLEIIVNKFRKKLDSQEGVVSFSLSARDTGGYCECDSCKAVGNISTRMLNLANNVARKLAKTHPNRYLLTFYAYWHSHEPPEPMLKAEPGVCAMFVNEGNHVRSWEEPETPQVAKELPRPILREINYFAGWKKTGAILGAYEWWIPSYDKNLDWLNMPWYPGDTTLKNLRYWKRSGVRFVTHENDEPYKKKEDRLAMRWPVYYVGARGMWDVNVTAEQVMREACQKLYGSASEPMLRFYRIIEKAMSESKYHGYSGIPPSPVLIYTDDIQQKATAFLEKAASLASDNKISRRIAHESRMWEKAVDFIAESKEGSSKKSTTGKIVLVDEKKTRAVIVVGNNENKNTMDAASALQDVVGQMTGVKLAIQKESEFDNQAMPIFVGMSKSVKKAGVDIAQDADGDDHYVISVKDNRILLIGNDGGQRRGSAYAVYDFLERFGCGWYRPDPLWHVIPKVKTLKAAELEVDQKPAIEHRDIWHVSDEKLKDAWRLGGKKVARGYILYKLVPREKYEKEHPEYFGQGQPCLTHPDVINIIVKQFREKLDTKEGVLPFSLCANDAGGYCECEKCQAVGNVSARMLNFANSVARKLSETHPGRFLLTFYAYWHSHQPPEPMIKAQPGVCVMLVNEGDHVHSWAEPETPQAAEKMERPILREIKALQGWKKTAALLAMYEWWIPGATKSEAYWLSVPWYAGETTLKNIRHWREQGVRFITFSTCEPFDSVQKRFDYRWPLYYVGARGMWDPDVSSKEVMREVCEKLYGRVSDDMFNYYQVIEKAMSKSKLHGSGSHLPRPDKIYTELTGDYVGTYLNRAFAMAGDKTIRQRIAQERQMWKAAAAVMAKLKEDTPEEQEEEKSVSRKIENSAG